MSLHRLGITTEFTTGTAGTVGETACWTYNIGELWDGTSRLIVALHGHGSVSNVGALQYNQNTGSGKATMALARTGNYVICSIEAAGPQSWSKPAALTAITSAVTAARARGVKTGKYGLLGWSMGGLETANQIKRDSANIAAAWTWAPALDMDYNYTAGGGTWTAEINTAFGGSTSAQYAGYNPAADYVSYRGLGVKWRICHATDDGTIPQSVSTGFVANVNDASITMRTPNITGDHTQLFANIPDAEVVAFFDAAAW